MRRDLNSAHGTWSSSLTSSSTYTSLSCLGIHHQQDETVETSPFGMRLTWLLAYQCEQALFDRETQSCTDSRDSLVICGIYYVLWIYVVPKLRGYRIRQRALILDNGAVSHSLIKVPVAELDEWDATHDAVGHAIGEHVGNNGYDGEEGYGGTKGVKNADGDNI
jgi:hypothetical protein